MQSNIQSLAHQGGSLSASTAYLMRRNGGRTPLSSTNDNVSNGPETVGDRDYEPAALDEPVSEILQQLIRRVDMLQHF